MADEYRQLKVSADQIDNAVNWVEKNKDEIEQDFLVVENCFDRIAAAEERLDENEEAVKWVEENKETIEQDSLVLDNCFDRIAAAEVKISKLESGQVEVDSDFSDTSENPVQNKVITEQFSHYYTTAETDEKITEKVSEIVAGAPEDFNTLKEMSDWLNQHEDSAATMNSAIQKNASDISTANTNITKNAEDIATANENIQANVDDITVVKNDVAINKTTLGIQCKNLLKTSAKANITKNGLTFSVQADGSVKVTGTATSNTTIDVYVAGDWQSKNVLYPLDSYRIHLQHDTNTTMTITVLSYDGETQSTVWVNNPVGGKVFTKFVTGIYITFRPTTGVTYDNYIYPMLTYADITDSTYEPYTPSISEQIEQQTNYTNKCTTELYNSCGTKNKIKIKSGIVKYGNFTITANSDGTVKVSPGTTTTLINMTASESWKTLTKITIPAGNYYFETNTESGVSSDIRKADGTVVCSNKNTCTITGETELYLNVRINANTTVSEEVILQPLFMLSYVKDRTYVPYIPTNAELQEQINTLLARIEALEGATATTEGGE